MRKNLIDLVKKLIAINFILEIVEAMTTCFFRSLILFYKCERALHMLWEPDIVIYLFLSQKSKSKVLKLQVRFKQQSF